MGSLSVLSAAAEKPATDELIGDSSPKLKQLGQ